MIVGTTVLRLDGNPYYSPEFPRGGLAATFTLDVSQVNLIGNFAVSIEHRNSEDTSWTSAGTFAVISSTGAYSKDVTGLKEIVRLVFNFTGSTATESVHFLVQAPSWRPYA